MKKVLIVDDEAHIRESLKEFLENYLIVDVASQEEARIAIQEHHIDCAIIDLKLDNTSENGGIEVFKLIKTTQPSIHCIILSAYPLEGDVEKEIDDSMRNEGNFEALQKEARCNYISKGGDKNYILAVMEKLRILEMSCDCARTY